MSPGTLLICIYFVITILRHYSCIILCVTRQGNGDGCRVDGRRGSSIAAINSGSIIAGDPLSATASNVFKYPYSELMIWAILLRRQQMAKFMWQMGDEALAKVVCYLFIVESYVNDML